MVTQLVEEEKNCGISGIAVDMDGNPERRAGKWIDGMDGAARPQWRVNNEK